MSDQGEPTAVSRKRPLIRPGFIGVLLLLATLALIFCFFRVTSYLGPTKEHAAKTQIREFEQALDLYRLDNGVYPTTCQGLQALVEKPTTEPIPTHYKTGGYLHKIPQDPWRNDYIYLNQEKKILILSFGADGKPGGADADADVDNLSP